MNTRQEHDMSALTPPAETPASLEERVDAALDVCDDVLTVLPELVRRLEVLEQAQPTTAPGEQRSDFRFEAYRPARTQAGHLEQVRRIHDAWDRLVSWVDWLIATNPRLANVIPACWAEHPTLREELVSLRVAWVGAWADTASPDAPAAWQERLYRTKARLADGNWGKPRCDGAHHPTGLDDPELHRGWAEDPNRDKALSAARHRAVDSLAPITHDHER